MKKRGKRLLAVMLTLVLIMGTLPAVTMTALAEDGSALQGAGTKADPYRVTSGSQLRAAIDQGKATAPVYIRLDAETVEVDPVAGSESYTTPPTLEISGKAVVLDLNGNTLRIEPADKGSAAISLDNGQLTIQDGTGTDGELITGCSRILDFDHQKTAQNIRKNAFTLESGILTNELRNGGGISSFDNTGKIEIKGGTIRTLGSWGSLLVSQSETLISGGSFVGEASGEQSGQGGVSLATSNCRITGGYFNCPVNMDYPNGNITGGYFAEGALSDSMKKSAFNNTKYGLEANDDPVYKWRVAEINKETVTNAPQPGDLYVGGVKVTEENAADILKDGTASFNAENNTLTLKGFHYSGPGYVYFDPSKHDGSIYAVSAGIYYQGRSDDVNRTDLLTIRLEGTDNTIDMIMPAKADYPEGKVPEYLDTSAAVYVEGADLKMVGDKLTASGAEEGKEKLAESCGIFVERLYAMMNQFGGRLTLEGCSIETEGRTATQERGHYTVGSSEGIYSEGDLLIKNADVKAEGGLTSNDSCGIYADSNIDVEGSTVFGIGGVGSSVSIGIFSEFDTQFFNSVIVAEGGEAVGESYGICVSELKIDKSSVDAAADEAGSYSDGIFASHITRIGDGSRVNGVSGKAGKSAAGIYIDSYLGVSGSVVTGTSVDSADSKNHGIHADYCLEVSGGSTVTGIAGASSKSKSIGINVDGDFIISGNSMAKATGSDGAAASRGADAEGVLSVEKGSTLDAVCGKAEAGAGVRCGRIIDGYKPVNYWDSADAYMDSIKANEENTKKDRLEGTILARGSEEGSSIGLELTPYLGDFRTPIPAEDLTGLQEEYEWLLSYTGTDSSSLDFLEFLNRYYKDVEKDGDGYTFLSEEYLENSVLNVTGTLKAQGAAGGVQSETVKGELKSVTLSAPAIRAGESYDGSDKAEKQSPLATEAVYRYVETEGGAQMDVANCPKDDSCPISKYSDSDPKGWYHDGVHFVLEQGIMNGTGTDTFAPNDPTTRGMIVTMLWRMEGSPSQSASQADLPKGESRETSRFDDVEDGAWYEEAVNWAASKKIVNGYDEKTFGPKDQITREQLAAILYRYADYKGQKDGCEASDLKNFTDAGRVSSWALEAMQWSVGFKIIGGMTETTLEPQGKATRAQVATMLMRLEM